MVRANDQTVNHGFADAVAGSQASFRQILKAMSRPGVPVTLTELPEGPTQLPSVFAAIALALCDYETPVWLDPELNRDAEVARYLTFNTGAQVTRNLDAAAFAFCSDATCIPPFEQFALGTLEYPDRSTTVVLLVEAFEGGEKICMTGPGITGQIEIAPVPLPDDFKARLALNRELYPRGIDLVLATRTAVVGLPRSVQIVE